LFEQNVEKTCVLVAKEKDAKVQPVTEPHGFLEGVQQKISLANRSSWASCRELPSGSS
jgi:hypothetical protein